MHRLFSVALPMFLAAGLLAAGPSATAAPAPEGSTFTSQSPVRVLDTRQTTGAVGPGATVTLDLSGRVPAEATAVVLNVTGVTPTAATFVTVFPAGAARPNTSSLNLVAGETRANQVTVALGTDRKVSLYNNAGATHLVADLAGYYATGAGAKYTALPASRVADTRFDGAPVGPGGTRVVDLNGRVPASATAVTFNLTATEVTAPTFVTAWPTGATRPNASNVNLTAGETRPNLVTVALSPNKTVSLYNNAGTAHLIVDLTGFYTPDYGATFVPMTPSRFLDTRDGTGTGGGPGAPVGPGSEVHVSFGDSLPATTTAVVLNLTGVAATTATYVTAYGPYRGKPYASTLNVAPGQTTPNAAVVALAQVPEVWLYNNSGSVHLLGDLAGVFAVTEPPCTADCVHAWGFNNVDRTLGTAEAGVGSATPKPVVALSGVRAVASNGSFNGYALKNDGTVWAWGNNDIGQLGNGWRGDNTVATGWGGGSMVPVRVQGLTGVTAIAASYYGAYALRSDGTVWAWGSGATGRLGNGHTDDSSVPVQVSGLTGVTAIASGWATGYALRSDGTVMAWGFNDQGQFGNGAEVRLLAVPVPVGLNQVTKIVSGYASAYAVRADGTVWSWGANNTGQLGNGQPCAGDPCVSRVPVQVSGLTGVTGVAASSENAFAVREDGTAWAWGTSQGGRLGNGVECVPNPGVCESRVPVRVSGLDDVTQVASFDFGGYALRADGTMWAWGDNLYQALGNDEVPDHTSVPVRVNGVSDVTAIAGGWLSGYAVVS
jgi:alpha-tubulin suppressor-like RCC1 family protein